MTSTYLNPYTLFPTVFSLLALFRRVCRVVFLHGALLHVDAHLDLELLVKYLVWDLAAEDHGVPLNERRLHLANEIIHVLVQLMDKIGITWLPIL